jgi:hypothetical protein
MSFCMKPNHFAVIELANYLLNFPNPTYLNKIGGFQLENRTICHNNGAFYKP